MTIAEGHMTLAALDALPEAEAERLFLGVCGSRNWARTMARARPYGDRTRLDIAARAAFASLDEGSWLEAFAAHPRIGDLETLRKKFSQEAREQGAVAQAGEEILRELKRLNDAYFERHGFIFIIFASGKSPAEMLAALKRRLPGARADELAQAAREQKLIADHRLSKLLSGGNP